MFVFADGMTVWFTLIDRISFCECNLAQDVAFFGFAIIVCVQFTSMLKLVQVVLMGVESEQ